jgi:hypothetical protein
MLQVNQLIGFGVGSGGAVPTMRGTPTAVVNGTSPRTIAHTVDAANRNCLIVRICFQKTNTGHSVTGVTWNGTALTQAAGSVMSSGNSYGAYVWYLINPAVGSFNVVVTYSATPNACYMRCENWQDVNPIAPIGGTAVDAQPASALLTANVTKTKSLSLIVAAAAWSSSITSATPGTDVIEEVDTTSSGNIAWLGKNTTNGNMSATANVSGVGAMAAAELNGDA